MILYDVQYKIHFNIKYHGMLWNFRGLGFIVSFFKSEESNPFPDCSSLIFVLCEKLTLFNDG